MLYTLGQAIKKVKRFVDSGTCSREAAVDRINEALERLMDGDAWDCLTVLTRIQTCSGCISLPYNADKIITCDIDGTPAKVFGKSYQFLSSGPGDLDLRGGQVRYRDLVDLGALWPTMFDMPSDSVEPDVTDGLSLVALCTEAEDETVPVVVSGFDSDGRELRRVQLPLLQWNDGDVGDLVLHNDGGEGAFNYVSLEKFASVSEVMKPETAGYVSLYAINADRSQLYLLGTYHPRQTIPQFHRYRVTGAPSDYAVNVLALLKLRYVPLVADEDVIPIDSLQALKLMVMSVTEENKLNIEGARVLAGQAFDMLQKREESRTLVHGTPTILDIDYRVSLGRGVNRKAVL